MTPITHALLPAVLSSPFLPRSTRRQYYVGAACIAVAGLLPDILTPHFSLAARYASWSHSVVPGVGFAILLFWVSLAMRTAFPFRLALLASFAYLSHLFLDGISGGVPGLYPFSPEIFGRRLIHFHYWLYFDAAFLLLSLVVFRWLPPWKWRARRSNEERASP